MFIYICIYICILYLYLYYIICILYFSAICCSSLHFLYIARMLLKQRSISFCRISFLLFIEFIVMNQGNFECFEWYLWKVFRFLFREASRLGLKEKVTCCFIYYPLARVKFRMRRLIVSWKHYNIYLKIRVILLYF